MDVILKKFPYRYMEYEYSMMGREINALFPHAKFKFSHEEPKILNLKSDELQSLYWLTFFSGYKTDDEWHETYQCIIERDDTLKTTKQHTRYSTHGIHEYKGKFNPQIVHCMVNILGLNENSIVIDPFNGSGTTILECAHMGVHAVGTDINPMACFISNTKIKALSIDVKKARISIAHLIKSLQSNSQFHFGNDERIIYLEKWIPSETLMILEKIRVWASSQAENLAMLILTIASNLIRDYSYQEPVDLRIRRRKSPFPEVPFLTAFKENIFKQLRKIEEIQNTIGFIETKNEAVQCDIKKDRPFGDLKFDAALTSPPYMTALPYIDTQRISLVWLGLCKAREIANLDSRLIGSREMHTTEKSIWHEKLRDNASKLPEELYSLILDMQKAISVDDGFRKQAVPILLYRYLAEMKDMFLNVAAMMKKRAPFALIVGHNKTTLGGRKFLINTPELLSKLAIDCGWRFEENIPLETYKRYGINNKNAICTESMVVLRTPNKKK